MDGVSVGVTKYIFDVDGTLTPSRGLIDPEFANWFEQFSTHNQVYLVTGSDREKTIEQVGSTVYNLAAKVYNCSGNDVYKQDTSIRSTVFELPSELRALLRNYLESSEFVLRTGNHIEERNGTVNFSIVGRNCTLGERKLYVKYDLATQERHRIATEINKQFPNITATVGGETGLDIYQKGADKSQILVDFNDSDDIHFYGDRMEPSGNDYPLAKALNFKNCFHSSNWQETWKLLQDIG